MAPERSASREAAPTPGEAPAWTLTDVLAQPSPDPNDTLPDDEWAARNPQVAGRLAEIAMLLRRSSPMKVSKKAAAFLQVAVDAGTDEPLPVKFLAATARTGTRLYCYDSDSKRVAKQLSTSAGAPLHRTPVGLVLETTRRKAPVGVSWHDLTGVQRDLLAGMSTEAIARELASNTIRSHKGLEGLGGLGGQTIARLAGRDYNTDVAKLLRDLVANGILRRVSPRRMAAGTWPSDAPFRPHPFLRSEEDQDPPKRRTELVRSRLLRSVARSTFRATRRSPRDLPPSPLN